MKAHLPVLTLALAIVVAASLGCSPQVNPDGRLWEVGESTSALDLQATRRGVYFRERTDGTAILCAEPAPDVAVSSDTSFTTGLTIPQIESITAGEASLALDAETTQQLVDLANRGQLLQVQREALYRLCELQANTGLSNVSIYELYDEVLFTIRIFALSDVLTVLAETEDGRAVVDAFLTAAITRSTRPTDLVGAGRLRPEYANILFSVSETECVRLRAAADVDLRAAMQASVDETFARLGRELDDRAEMREVVEALCNPSPSD